MHPFLKFLENGEILFDEEKGFIIFFREGSIFMPVRAFNFLERKLIEEFGLEKAKEILKLIGKFQVEQALKRYVKILNINQITKEDITNFGENILTAMGIGKFKIERIDDKAFEVISPSTIFSFEARLEYSSINHVWDFYVCGMIERAFEILLGKKFICEEVECYAKGGERCRFVCKALE